VIEKAITVDEMKAAISQILNPFKPKINKLLKTLRSRKSRWNEKQLHDSKLRKREELK
jgi:hypothetical protein